MNHKTKATDRLKLLTGKKHIVFTDRGNTAILLALKLAKSLGKTTAFLQDQGGWITYSQYTKKLKFEQVNIGTDYGIVEKNNLKNLDNKSVLLINSMPGYFAVQENMKEIENICRKKDIFLINDASGTIGLELAKYGDIILGSFGEWKPVEVGYGGFLAFDGDYTKLFEENNKRPVNDFYEKLIQELAKLKTKQNSQFETAEKIKKQLKDFDIIHRERKGYNVIVKFSSNDERAKIVDFCKIYNYEFTMCPRYIRVNEDAVSIEVKRLN
ncbi:MAG: DegT/DnrJ/EryC1/StrS family aminotransferase [archaeon]